MRQVIRNFDLRCCLFVFLILSSFPFLSCATLSESTSPRRPTISQKNLEIEERSYRIRSGDILKIEIWRVPLLSQEVSVGLDGTFLYPLLGSVPAKGKTIDEVREYLAQELGKSYLVDPVITVALGSETQGFFVVGEVKNPGAFQLKESISVYQAIITAGGFTDFGSKHVKIVRKSGGQRKVIRINIKKYEKAGQIDPEAEIQPGDIVVVPKKWL